MAAARKVQSKAKATKARPAARSAKLPAVKRAQPTKPKKSSKPQRKTAGPAAVGALPMLVIDAFTRRRFSGNPAAVVICEDAFLPDEIMQAIAAENNLAETAFVVIKSLKGSTAKVNLRWFTPTQEVDLCGHATLAAAHALFHNGQIACERIAFSTKSSGILTVDRFDHLYVMDFPANRALPIDLTKADAAALASALGKAPSEVYLGRDLMCIFENKRDVHELRPDFTKLAALTSPRHLGVITSAPGAGHDFVSRCFYPKAGVSEDPVTGSAHCQLTPYWSARLGKLHLSAHQVSARGGELLCEFKPNESGDRVLLSGHAITGLAGAIYL